ncbi:MAG: phenylalanine--tRNA ligase subunit beta [Saprospiraceae bacterium]
MKVSLNWLRDYINLDLAPEKIGEILTDIGLELEGIERTETVKGSLKGVVTGLVLECSRHPNADKLSLTRVDVGTNTPLSIVCGAPNVAVGQKVLVATPGTTLYPAQGDPITIKTGKIRGETSEGMICAEDELGLGNDHSGIIVLPPDTPIGIEARTCFNLHEDQVFEIGLTPNRTDATNHLGVARDLAAALRINYGHSGDVLPPSVDHFTVDNETLPIAVEITDCDACPRYAGVSIQGVTVGESPAWLKERLTAIGQRPINNVVDATNYVLNELGQPLHAFDLDQIKGGKIIVKTLAAGTPFMALDQTERILGDQDLMICDGESNGMCIAGVFGGLHSGVSAQTVNVFLESAHFNPTFIRRTSVRHNLRTDAARVFEKGSDPNIAVYALKRAALLIQELAGGKIASKIVDSYPRPVIPKVVNVRYAHVNALIGANLGKNQIEAILEALGMEISSRDEVAFTVKIPTNKTDIYRPADVIEEILRIYGFNKVDIPDKFHYTLNLKPQPDPSAIRNTVADLLAASGFHEMMALSLTQSRYYRGSHPYIPEADWVFINNTSNAHLDIMRPDLLMSGLEAIVHNQNRRQNRIRLFEFGKCYRKNENGGFTENFQLALFLCGERWAQSRFFDNEAPATFFTLKAYVQKVLLRMGLKDLQEKPLQHQAFNFGLQLTRGTKTFVEMGRVHSAVSRDMGVKGEVFAAVFHWDALLEAVAQQRIRYSEINKFPAIRRDLALVIDNSVKFADIASIARKVGKNLIRDLSLFDVYANETQLGTGKQSYAVSFTFENHERTLQDKEVDQVMDQLIKEYEVKLNAFIRR